MQFIALANFIGFALALAIHGATLCGYEQAVAKPGMFQGLLFGAFALAYPLTVQYQRDRLDALKRGQSSWSFLMARLGRLPAWSKALWVIVCLYALANTAISVQRLDRASPAAPPPGVTRDDGRPVQVAPKTLSSEQFGVVMRLYSGWWLAFYLGLGLLALACTEREDATSPFLDGQPPARQDGPAPPDGR